jgi:hypothetical protein
MDKRARRGGLSGKTVDATLPSDGNYAIDLGMVLMCADEPAAKAGFLFWLRSLDGRLPGKADSGGTPAGVED